VGGSERGEKSQLVELWVLELTFLSKTVPLPSVVSPCYCTTKTPFSHYRFFALLTDKTTGFPWWLRSKESACQCRRRTFDPWPGKIPWRRKQWPTPVFLPGKCHGQRSPAGLQPTGLQRVGHSLATEQQQQQAEHGLLWHPCFSKQTWLKSKESECAINCEWLSWKNKKSFPYSIYEWEKIKNHFRILSMNGKWHGNVWWVVVGMGGGMLNN